jgi:hypothetical protein
MDFTRGEISELKLRLIAFATDSGPLIAGFDVCDKQSLSARGGDEPERRARVVRADSNESPVATCSRLNGEVFAASPQFACPLSSSTSRVARPSVS